MRSETLERYLDTLSEQLSRPVVEELADGLEETWHRHLRLLTAGPAVGLCWAVVLVTGHAWNWPVPVPARIVPGVALVAVVVLLAVAVRGIRYRSVGLAGAAGCIGTAALDAFMIIGVLAADPAARWAAAVAMTASAARLVFSVRLLRPVLTWGG